MNPFRCPCVKFQKGRSGCGERKRFHLREITRVCQTEREKRAATFAYLQEVAFPITRRVWSLSPQTLCQLEPQFFFLPPHPSDPHGEGKSAEFLLPLNAH